MKKEPDWMGLWYDIIKERGENDCPTFGQVDLKTNTVKWLNFSHSKMDGIGAMIDFYEKTDYKLDKYPTLKEKSAPNFFERLLIFYHLLFQSKKIKTTWKENNFLLEPEDPFKISYTIFNLEETKKIETYCKRNNFSVNAFLMNITTKFLLSHLSLNKEGTWTLPVNLRPILKKENIKSNHSSAILVSMNKNDSPSETHKKISCALKNKEHWGIWWIHQIGKFIGIKGMRYISNKNAKKNFFIGSFSNLGAWNLPPDHIWIGCPPGSKNFPISVSVMKANGQMSFSLKIHPFVLKDSNQTAIFHEGLIEFINKTALKQAP